jgi:hypothetical protein
VRKALSLVLLLSVLPACDDERAAQIEQSRAEFETALATYREADRGIVPAAPGAEPGRTALDLQGYRQQQLQKAAEALKGTLAQGTDSQKVAAYRLLADTAASSARHHATEAMQAWAALEPRTSNLLEMLLAVDRANARVNAFDAGPGEALLAELNKAKAAAQERVQLHEATIAKLRPVIDDLAAQVAKFDKASQESKAQAAQLSTQAFTSSGDQQVSLYERADKAERAAASAEAEGRNVGVRLEVSNSELAIASRQLELAKEALTNVQKQIADAEGAQAELRGQREEALRARQEAAAALKASQEAVAADYQAQVVQPFQRAIEEGQQAVKHLSEALTRAPGNQGRSVQADLLAKQVALADIMLQRVIANAGYGKVLSVLAAQAQRLMPDSTSFATDAKDVAAAGDEAASQTQQQISEALGLAAELGGSPDATDPATTFANEQSESLDQYKQRLAEVRGEAAPAAPTPAPAPAPTPAAEPTPAPEAEAPAPAPAAPAPATE